MKSQLWLFASFFCLPFSMLSQNTSEMAENSKLPYYQIPDAPEDFTAGNVAGRLIDGLGYRYYWATEGLREEDLNYQVSEDSRPVIETLEHVHHMSRGILNSIKGLPTERSEDELDFAERRKQTLENFKMASDLLKASKDGDMENFNIIFQRGEQRRTFPFWNLLNGQIADCIYHVGQVVALRRASGNPMDGRVNVFLGKNRE